MNKTPAHQRLERFNFFCSRPDGSARSVVSGFSLLRRPIPAKAEDYFPSPSRLQYFLNRSKACPALSDAGGVREISRWSSELGERTPPDHRHHGDAPRRGAGNSSAASGTPSGVRSFCGCDLVVFARASSAVKRASARKG